MKNELQIVLERAKIFQFEIRVSHSGCCCQLSTLLLKVALDNDKAANAAIMAMVTPMLAGRNQLYIQLGKPEDDSNAFAY